MEHRTATGEGGEVLHALLDSAVRNAPDQPAVRDGGGCWTYAELARAAEAVSAWLDENAVRRGDRLVVQLPTDRRLVALLFGASRRGVVFVPVNPATRRHQLRSIVANAAPTVVVTNDEGRSRFEGLCDAPIVDLDEVCAGGRSGSAAVRSPGPGPDDVAVLIYTSGSTAEPKAVVCPHAQMTFAVRALVTALGYRSDDRVFCRFPMSWDYGLCKVLMTAAVRCEVILADRESDLSLLTRMRDCGATVVPLVPSLATMIVQLAGRSERERPPVRLFTNTGAALSPVAAAALRTHFPQAVIVRQYGQTEAKRITVMPPDEEFERPGSVGRALPGTEVRVVDPEGRPLPPGEVGEIVASGPHVMGGYWRNPELTARTFTDADGDRPRKLHTGDFGRLDADGYLYFEGRRDDMFKRKGFRMSTLEIEAAALDVAGVRAAAVLPPDGERDLVLFVESDLDQREVIRELRMRLEPAKVPAICRVLDRFPLTLHGKSSRPELEQMLRDS